MRIYAANSVFIEVTRRCNMCCAHCLRGDAESIDIQEKYIDAFLDSFEKGAYISSLTFTGGEISLNIPAIRYLFLWCQYNERVGAQGIYQGQGTQPDHLQRFAAAY